MRRKSEHSDWIWNQVDRLVYGKRADPFVSSVILTGRTTAASDWRTKLQIWQDESKHSGAFRLAWSDWNMDAPLT